MDSTVNQQPPPIILLSSHRAGTNLLARTLATDPGLQLVFEPFAPSRDQAGGNFWAFLKDRGLTQAPVVNQERELQLRDWLSELSAAQPGKRLLIEVKMHVLRHLDASWLWPGDIPTVIGFFRRLRCPFIFLRRRNILEQICSFDLAHQTAVWVRQNDPETTKSTVNINVDAAGLPRRLRQFANHVDLARAWLDGYPLVLDLEYEKLLDDGQLSQAVVDGIATLTGQPLAPKRTPAVAKVSPPLQSFVANYAEVAGTLAETEFACLLTGEQGSTQASKPPKEVHFAFRIVSTKPLVTISSASLTRVHLAELARRCPHVFGSAGVHFVWFSWSVEVADMKRVAAAVADAQQALPGHLIVTLAANEAEFALLSRYGLECMLGNHLIFADETIWKPLPPGGDMFDAVYVARLDPYKRHELSAAIDSLLLIYGHSLSCKDDDALARARSLLPRAVFANHDFNDGRYELFSPSETRGLLSRSRVGLCLSKVEGCMRASMEYLLCGLPIVSTRSTGGRDRYFAGTYCRVVADDPGEIAQAVQKSAERNFDRNKIRSHVADLLGFDRYQFLQNAERLVRRHTGAVGTLTTIRPFRGSAEFEAMSEIVEQFQSAHPSP